jgi:hypothetical protein
MCFKSKFVNTHNFTVLKSMSLKPTIRQRLPCMTSLNWWIFWTSGKFRATVIGKTGKTTILPRFYVKELDHGIAVRWRSCLSKIFGSHPELQNWVDSNVRGLPSFFCVRFDFLHSSTLKGRKARETLELEKKLAK